MWAIQNFPLLAPSFMTAVRLFRWTTRKDHEERRYYLTSHSLCSLSSPTHAKSIY